MDLSLQRRRKAKAIVWMFSIFTLGTGFFLYLCLRLLFDQLAKRNTWVTFRADGEIKAIMRGDNCIGYLMQVENNRIDPDGFDLFKGSLMAYADHLAKASARRRGKDPGFIEKELETDDQGLPKQVNGHYKLKEEVENAIDEANASTLFEEIFGVVWIGFAPYRVFEYLFRWLKYGQQKAEGGVPSDKVGIHAREDRVDSLFYRYPQYGVVIDNAETGAGKLATATGLKVTKVQVKATLVFETETTNPQKTLFRTAAISSAGDWQQALAKEIHDRARKWIGSIDWDKLVQEQKEVEDGLRAIKTAINGVDEDSFMIEGAEISSVRDYGQKILKISMPNIDLKDATLQTAIENVFKAERKRDEDMAKAAGDRALAAAPVQGKADGLALIGQIPSGPEMFMAEQLGHIGVYAPGRDGIFLNVAERTTGNRPPTPPKGGDK